MKRNSRVLLSANAALAVILTAGVVAPDLLRAQTAPPKLLNCCQTEVSGGKFCCKDCCFTGPICDKTSGCKSSDEDNLQ